MNRACLSLLAIAAASLLLAGCQTPSAGQSIADGGDSRATTSDTSNPVAQVVRDLTLASHQLAIDHDRNKIWLATIQPAGEDTLWSVDLKSEEVQSFTLPDVDDNGYTSHIRVGKDGAVWVSLPYELVRVDPDSGTIASLPFPEEVDGALPGALDRETTVPGTWLSGILPDEGGILVARNNVPYLTHVDNDMAASRGAELGTDDAGPIDLASLEPGAREAWTRVNDVGLAVAYDTSAGTLTRHTADGTQQTLQLEQMTGVKSGGGISATGERDESDKTIQIPDRITDFVIGDDGSVWFLRHSGTQLARWMP